MSLPARYNLRTHYSGDDFYGIKFEFYDGNNEPISFTGSGAKMQVRVDYGSPVILEWSTQNGTILIENNIIYIKEKSGTQMSVPQEGNYKYDIQIMYSDGRVLTYVRGYWTFQNDITR